ncbi:zonadhesin-like [Scyliorhinus torazame]|uniref:zonadhesin-like n=1 Tax=Scyliorhinus torazame TaxID=75743 RepID=UPI003B5A56D8
MGPAALAVANCSLSPPPPPTAVFRSCRIAGDPHYRTFDGYRHHYQGRYTYTLSKTIAPGNLQPFNLEGKNARRRFFSRVSFLEAVRADVYGHSVVLMKRRRLVVDGIRVQPPYQPREGLRIYQRSRAIHLETDFGLTINFDGHSNAVITLPSTYQSHVRGLCGNYDGRRNNEFMKPDGTVVRSVNVFGNSWRVPRKHGREPLTPRLYKRELGDSDSGFTTDSCSPQQLALMNGSDYCGALSSPGGPFSGCHSTVDPTAYQENCVFDLCAIYNNTQLLCDNLEAYSQSCQDRGVRLDNWRQRTGCEPACWFHPPPPATSPEVPVSYALCSVPAPPDSQAWLILIIVLVIVAALLIIATVTGICCCKYRRGKVISGDHAMEARKGTAPSTGLVVCSTPF